MPYNTTRSNKPLDPNRAFRLKQGRQPVSKVGAVIMIRCDATNCGHKTVVSREIWISEKPIVCNNCGSTHAWGTL